MDKYNPEDPYLRYDHPYFGQIFLAGLFSITGYQNLFNSSEDLNYEMILLIPRIFMGILALVDTFLIFKIAELRYNRNVGFIASILFAVMPMTWLTRWIHLDSIQLPLTLLSVLFALLYFRRDQECASIYDKKIFLVSLSGIFLGLSIFTKIPAFTMVPLIGYLVFTNSNRDLKILGLWFVPVLLIPLIWPMYSISAGDFNKWVNGVNVQTHRQPNPLQIPINELLLSDPLLLIFGFVGIAYAAVKKDLFIILAVAPFLLFMFFINRVAPFHLLLLIAILCISASRLFDDIINYTKKINKIKPLRLISVGGVSIIVFLGLVISIETVDTNENSQYFEAAAFVDHYIKANKGLNDSNNNGFDENVSVISQPFFSWVQKYKFHDSNYIPHLMISKKLMFRTGRIITISDSQFRNELQAPEGGLDIGIRFKRIFSAFSTNAIANFNSSSYRHRVDVLLTNLEMPIGRTINVTNLLDKTYDWKHSRYVKIERDTETMNITADNNKSKKSVNVNTAFLRTPLNTARNPIFLFVDYYAKSDHDRNVTFSIEMRDSKNKLLWNGLLETTHRGVQKEFFVIPAGVSEQKVLLNLKIRNNDRGIHTLSLNSLKLLT